MGPRDNKTSENAWECLIAPVTPLSASEGAFNNWLSQNMVSFAFLNVGACLNSQHAGMSPFCFPSREPPDWHGSCPAVALSRRLGSWGKFKKRSKRTKRKKKETENERQFQRESSLPICQVMWVFGVTKLTTSNNQTKPTQKYNLPFFGKTGEDLLQVFFLRRCFLEVLGDNFHEWTNRRCGSNPGLPHHNQTPRLAMASCCWKRQWWMQNRRSTVGAHGLLVKLKGLFSPPNMWAFRDASPRHPVDTTCENEEGYPRFKKTHKHISIHMVTVHECASSS